MHAAGVVIVCFSSVYLWPFWLLALNTYKRTFFSCVWPAVQALSILVCACTGLACLAAWSVPGFQLVLFLLWWLCLLDFEYPRLSAGHVSRQDEVHCGQGTVVVLC